MPVAVHIDLGGQAAAAASPCMVYGFLRSLFCCLLRQCVWSGSTWESIIHVPRSISPSSSLSWSRSRTASKVPSSCPCRNRSLTGFQKPYRSGRSRHFAPKHRIWNIPFSTWWSFRRGRSIDWDGEAMSSIIFQF